MKEKVIGIIADVLGMSADEVNSAYSDSNLWDSLKKVEIVFALEDEFGIMFEQEEIAEMKTPESIVECVEKKQ